MLSASLRSVYRCSDKILKANARDAFAACGGSGVSDVPFKHSASHMHDRARTNTQASVAAPLRRDFPRTKSIKFTSCACAQSWSLHSGGTRARSNLSLPQPFHALVRDIFCQRCTLRDPSSAPAAISTHTSQRAHQVLPCSLTLRVRGRQRRNMR